MNEKLWTEFLKTPQPRKEKETLGEAVTAAVEEVKQELEEASLSPGELTKRNNLQVFLDKIKNGEGFEMVSGEQVSIDPTASKQYLDSLTFGTPPSRGVYLYTTLGDPIRLSQIKKTSEFGGRGKDFFIKKEIAARGQLETLINQALAAANTDAIVIKIVSPEGKELAVYDDVIGVEDTAKLKGVDPKSDFQLIRKDGKPPVYISHKHGSSARNFGQWSGLTAKAGESITRHPEVVQFIKDLQPFLNKETEDGKTILTYPRGLSIARKIKDVDLRRMGIYGQDYAATGKGGPNNVDLVAQGTFFLKTVGVDDPEGEPEVAYILTATPHLLVRGEYSDFDGDYEPVLMTRFASARKNYGIRGLRVSIYPSGGRKVHKWI